MRFNVYEDTAGGIWNCLSTNSWDEALKHAERINIKRKPYIRDKKFNLTYNLATKSWYQFKIVRKGMYTTAGMYPTDP